MTKLLWMIDKDHINTEPGDSKRINWGQRLREATETNESFSNVIFRTIYMATDCSVIEIPSEQKIRWKAYDDDGILYYEGHISSWALFDSATNDDEEEDLAYNVDRFCMEDAGAVHVYWNLKDIANHKPEYAARHPKSNKDGWIEIYG